MTTFLGPINSNPKAAMRERGYNDGSAGREARPPSDPDLAAAYAAGYRRGQEAWKALHPGRSR